MKNGGGAGCHSYRLLQCPDSMNLVPPQHEAAPRGQLKRQNCVNSVSRSEAENHGRRRGRKFFVVIRRRDSSHQSVPSTFHRLLTGLCMAKTPVPISSTTTVGWTMEGRDMIRPLLGVGVSEDVRRTTMTS